MTTIVLRCCPKTLCYEKTQLFWGSSPRRVDNLFALSELALSCFLLLLCISIAIHVTSSVHGEAVSTAIALDVRRRRTVSSRHFIHFPILGTGECTIYTRSGRYFLLLSFLDQEQFPLLERASRPEDTNCISRYWTNYESLVLCSLSQF